MNIIIAVCTYRRYESLKRCLNSIQSIIIPDNMTVHIVVIDNEPSWVVADICTHNNISYIAEPHRGLVFARNAVLAYARTQNPDYLGIIDDDEVVSQEWLQDMLRAFQKTNADVIAGIIDIKLDDTMPRYLKTAYQFKKVSDIQAVKTVPMGNIMLSKNIIHSDMNFDSRFNFTGGEDIDFFKRASHKGYTLFKIPNAQVTEYLMPEKASLKAYFKRQIRVSKLHYAEKYPKISVQFMGECVVSVFEILCVLLVLPLAFFSDTLRVKITKILAKAIGRLLSRQSQAINAYGV